MGAAERRFRGAHAFVLPPCRPRPRPHARLMRGEFVDLGGVRLYCYASGSRGAGDPLVLVHGCFTSSRLWQDLLPRLPKGHRVLVLDLLGHGRSDPAVTRPVTIGAHAERLGALLATMGITAATLVGHGLGAAVAAVAAHRDRTRIARLALVNPVFLARDAREAASIPRFGRLTRLLPLWKRLSPGWLASALHAALLPGYIDRTAGSRSLDVYLKPYRTAVGRDSACAQLQALRRPDAGEALTPGALPSATLLVTGALDAQLPASRADRLWHALRDAAGPEAVAHRLSGAGHMVPEEAPDRLATAIAELLTR